MQQSSLVLCRCEAMHDVWLTSFDVDVVNGFHNRKHNDHDLKGRIDLWLAMGEMMEIYRHIRSRHRGDCKVFGYVVIDYRIDGDFVLRLHRDLRRSRRRLLLDLIDHDHVKIPHEHVHHISFLSEKRRLIYHEQQKENTHFPSRLLTASAASRWSSKSIKPIR